MTLRKLTMAEKRSLPASYFEFSSNKCFSDPVLAGEDANSVEVFILGAASVGDSMSDDREAIEIRVCFDNLGDYILSDPTNEAVVKFYFELCRGALYVTRLVEIGFYRDEAEYGPPIN